MISPASLANLRKAPNWQPGQSGNSRGSSRGYRRVIKIARDASPEAMEALVACMRDKTAAWTDRIRAAQAILDRSWGTEAKVEIDMERVQGITITIERGQVNELEQQPLTIEGHSSSGSVD